MLDFGDQYTVRVHLLGDCQYFVCNYCGRSHVTDRIMHNKSYHTAKVLEYSSDPLVLDKFHETLQSLWGSNA